MSDDAHTRDKFAVGTTASAERPRASVAVLLLYSIIDTCTCVPQMCLYIGSHLDADNMASCDEPRYLTGKVPLYHDSSQQCSLYNIPGISGVSDVDSAHAGGQ